MNVCPEKKTKGVIFSRVYTVYLTCKSKRSKNKIGNYNVLILPRILQDLAILLEEISFIFEMNYYEFNGMQHHILSFE